MLTRLLIGIVTVNTVLSQLLLKRAIGDIRAPDSLSAFPAFVMAAVALIAAAVAGKFVFFARTKGTDRGLSVPAKLAG